MNKTRDKLILSIIIVSFVLGFVFSFITKPFSWYDEHTHFSRSIELSYGDFMVQGNPANVMVGGRIDEGEMDFINAAIFLSDGTREGFSLDCTSEYNQILRKDNLVFYASTNTITNHPIVYFPYIIAAWISALLNIAPVYELYLMRTMGFLCFFCIYLFAINKAKKARFPLALLLLCPIFSLTFSSVTADAYLLAVTTLYFAVLFETFDRVLQNDIFNRKDLIEIAIVTVLMSFCKMPSFLWIGLWIPVAVYAYRKNRFLYRQLIAGSMASVAVAAIITLGFFVIVKDVNSGAFWGKDVDTSQQLSYLLSNPLHALKIFVFGILNYTNYLFIQTGYISNFACQIPFVISALFYIGIFYSTKEKRYSSIAEPYTRDSRLFDGCTYVLSLAYVIMVFIMLYLQFSAVGTDSVGEGVQPRYFVPVIIALLFVYIYHKPKIYDNVVIPSVILSVMPTVFYMYSNCT